MRLMSWNIQWAKGVDGRVDPERIAAYLEAQQPDLIALQEVCRHYPANTGDSPPDQPAWFEQRFRTLGGRAWQTIFSPATDRFHPATGQRQQFGNLLASHYPIAEVRHHPLPRPPDPACLSSSRAALELLLQTPLGWLRLITTHLEYYSPIQRQAQAAYLRHLHQEGCDGYHSPPQTPNSSDTPLRTLPTTDQTLICGDLNAPPDNPAIRQLFEPFPSPTPPLFDGWHARYPNHPHPPTLGVHPAAGDTRPPLCMDYLIGTAHLLQQIERITVDPTITASDHQPLIIDFREP